MKKNGSLLFLNTPIACENEDVLGIDTYIQKLNAAIDSDAQMIAVTSPFGAGKTSIIELLHGSRTAKKKSVVERFREMRSAKNDKHKISNKEKKKKERIVKVSMWSHLGKDEEDSVNDDTICLHRTFVYQLASQIDHKRGTYISRRLSKNYGLLKINTNRTLYWLPMAMTFLFAAACWGLNAFPRIAAKLHPLIANHIPAVTTLLIFFAVILGLFVLTRADILISSNKSEGGRVVESDEIIDLYRTEILKHSRVRKAKGHKGTRFIVIIEDLDRTSNETAVVNFLKELRKYYVPMLNGDSKYKNTVTFIVNIKPEALLRTAESDMEKQDAERESLYAKIFDYVLNLQTINIDNYDAVLEGLLMERMDAIRMLEIPAADAENPTAIPGMQWIIRERRIGIREIKERLNIAFTLFESLKNKFPKSNITFEKCAVAAYLTTAFEQDFNATDHRAFQKLVDLYLENKNVDFERYADHLRGTCGDYIKTVWDLIKAKLIDSSYRIYFYNYPKNSYLHTADESCVINAILYGERAPELETAAKRAAEANSSVFSYAFSKISQLGILLPDVVFQDDTLYVEAMRLLFDGVKKKIASLDYSADATEKTIALFKRLLSYDASRHVYDAVRAASFCEIWEATFGETALLQLRMMLCTNFPNEILWYRTLFFGVHGLISNAEMDLLALPDVLQLINLEAGGFSIREVKYIQSRFEQEEQRREEMAAQRADILRDNAMHVNAEYIKNRFDQEKHAQEELSAQMEKFLRDVATTVLEAQEMAPVFLEFMRVAERIVPDFESTVFNLLDADEELDEHETQELFDAYQRVINQTASAGDLSEGTLENISQLDQYDGYLPEVVQQLYANEYYIDYILLTLRQGGDIKFEEERLRSALEEHTTWLLKDHPDIFVRLRHKIVETQTAVLSQFAFLFTDKCPVLTSAELEILKAGSVNYDNLVMELIPAELVTEDTVEMLVGYFCRRKQPSDLTFNILTYISGFTPALAEECFFKLDFNMIRYRYISSKRKKEIKESYADILHLDTPEGKLKFMEATRFLDAAWETNLTKTLKENNELQKQYIAIVNSCETITKTTIQTVCSLGITYPMSPLVNEKFYESKRYMQYVASKTLQEEKFIVEPGERGDFLWTYYVKIFGIKDYYPKTRKYMAENHEFLREIMDKKAYKGMPEENRMQLCGIYQDSDCLLNVLEYGLEFALSYYMKIEGFKDEEAAMTFVKILEQEPGLLESKELYDHIHPKLINGKLKFRYTNLRKKSGHDN